MNNDLHNAKWEEIYKNICHYHNFLNMNTFYGKGFLTSHINIMKDRCKEARRKTNLTNNTIHRHPTSTRNLHYHIYCWILIWLHWPPRESSMSGHRHKLERDKPMTSNESWLFSKHGCEPQQVPLGMCRSCPCS